MWFEDQERIDLRDGKKEQQIGRIGQICHQKIKEDVRMTKQRMRPNLASGPTGLME